VSRLSKTASAAIAAAVVSGAAAIAPLVGPSATGDDGGPPAATAAPSPSGSPSGSASGPAAGSASGSAAGSTSGSAGDEASAVPAAGAGGLPGALRPALLFVGDSPALRPRGGSARSFACQAAVALQRSCVVASRAAGLPRSTRAAAVVLVMTAKDDAATVRAALDALPVTLRSARTVVLAPVAVVAAKPVAAAMPAIWTLAAARGVDVVDPAALHWVTAGTRATLLAADGVQPTAAGIVTFADRLSRALAAAGV